jgi:Tol biopolymer transport system component
MRRLLVRRSLGSVIFVLGLLTLAAGGTAMGAVATTTLVSVNSAEEQGNDSSEAAAISADGRYVAFASAADNLSANDNNYVPDIFVRDRVAGVTEVVSVASDGTPADNYSLNPDISADGRYVCFESFAGNLVPNDVLFGFDIYVHDRETGTTEMVSVSSSEQQSRVFGSDLCAISADGRYVAFQSYAEELVPGDTNDTNDIFVRDRQTGTTERVSVTSSETQANDLSFASFSTYISGDGRFVALASFGDNLVPNDSNNKEDIFVRDRVAGTTERVSVSSAEVQGNGDSFGAAISVTGRFVSFSSFAKNLVPRDSNGQPDVFLRDCQRETTEMVSVNSQEVQGNWHSTTSAVSANGRFVAFESYADNLAPQDINGLEDIFLRDRRAGTTVQVSVSNGGVGGNLPSHEPDITADGSAVSFDSESNNLVPNDDNQLYDVFVYER